MSKIKVIEKLSKEYNSVEKQDLYLVVSEITKNQQVLMEEIRKLRQQVQDLKSDLGGDYHTLDM